MTQYLPPNLLALFAARDPIPYRQPVDKLSSEKKRVPYGGLAHLLKEFEDPKDTPPPTRVETRDERKERKRKERAEQHAYKLEQDLALWDPATTAPGEAYKTLFVARTNYDTSESKLRREFEVYGPVKRITLIHDKYNSKPRGYAFIEYEHERDMHSAYKHADGKKIDGRRVLVDVERGRTVKGWRPRRLGGGLGGTRKGGPDENTRFSGRDEYARESFRGEDRVRERSRSRERERRRSRSRERERERERERPRRRSRSRERRRSRSRERRRSREREGPEEEEEIGRPKDRKRSRRSRSRDRKRSRSPRDRKRSRRSRSKERRRRRDPGEEGFDEVVVKQEKDDDYGYGGINGSGNVQVPEGEVPEEAPAKSPGYTSNNNGQEAGQAQEEDGYGE